MQFLPGQIVFTKKDHPCGGNKWEIVRIGADIKIKCTTCGHIIMLSQEELLKRIKK